MKTTDEKHQAATQVNVLSPENCVIEEADSLQTLADNMGMLVIGGNMTTFSGSQASAW